MGRGKVFPASKARSLLNPARHLVQSPRRIVRALGVDTDARVLEVGCGPGYFSPAIAEAVPEGALVLADLQAEMLQLARQRTAAHDNVRFVQLDVSRLPFASATFDAVVVVLMLGEVPDRELCLGEFRRVLRPAGVALFAEIRTGSAPRLDVRVHRSFLGSVVGPRGAGGVDQRRAARRVDRRTLPASSRRGSSTNSIERGSL